MTQNTFHGKIDRNVVTIGRKNMGKKTDKSTVGLILTGNPGICSIEFTGFCS